MALPIVTQAAQRIVVLGMPDAGKSSLLGALARVGVSQTLALGGELREAGGLASLSHQLYEEHPRETQDEVVAYPVRVIGNGPGQTNREAVVIDCDGRVANALLSADKPVNQTAHGQQLASEILRADSLVFVVDAGVPDDLRDKDFREYARFLKRFSDLRAGDQGVGGLPVFLAMSKVDKLAHPQMNAGEWQRAIEDRCHEAARRFREVLDEDPTGPDGYWKFGSLDFHVSPCAVRRPRLADMPAQTREPYGVAELFHEVFADAADFRHRTEKSGNLLSWILAGIGGLLGTLAVSGSLLLLNPVGDSTPMNGLAARVERLQVSDGPGAVARLASGTLEKRLKLYQEIQNDPEFDRLSETQKNYIRLRREEAVAHLRFQEELAAVPPISKCRSLAELAEIEKRLTNTSAPAVYASEWAGTDAVLLRERLLTKDLPQLRGAVGTLTNHFHSLKNRGSALLLEATELTPEWERRGRELTAEAEKSRPFAKADPLLGPAWLFDEVSFAESDWIKLTTRLGHVRDLAAALGMSGNPAETAPLAPVENTSASEALESASKRLTALRKLYPDSNRWTLADMPDAAMPEFQKRIKRSAEGLIRDGQRLILARMKTPGAGESAAQWRVIGASLLSEPDWREWRELTNFVTRLYDPSQAAIVDSTAKFLRETSFAFEFKHLSLRIPDTLTDQIARPTGEWVITCRKGASGETQKVTLKLDAGEPRREKQSTIHSFVAVGEAGIKVEPGDIVTAEVTLKKNDQTEVRLTWNVSRTKTYQFESLQNPPKMHDPKLAAEKGVTADGVSLSVTEGRFTPAPLLLPDFR